MGTELARPGDSPSKLVSPKPWPTRPNALANMIVRLRPDLFLRRRVGRHRRRIKWEAGKLMIC